MKTRDAVAAESHVALDERIRKRAHELWMARNGNGDGGTALEDWLAAEREVLGEGKQAAQDRGTVVGPFDAPKDIEESGEA